MTSRQRLSDAVDEDNEFEKESDDDGVDKNMGSDVERRQRSRSRTTIPSKRTAIYVDYKEDYSKRSGICVDTERQNVPNMTDNDDERTPLLRERERLQGQIIAEINRVDAQADRLLTDGENLAVSTSKYFGEDKKVQPREKLQWKRLCCCCWE